MNRSRVRDMVWLLAAAIILALTALLLRNWLPILLTSGPARPLPTSERREVLTELTITWLFKQELAQGRILSEWNPTWFSGFPWLRFLSYPTYYAVAALSLWGHVSLETALVIFYFLVMAGSGLVMFGYLRHVLGDWRAALVGAVIYQAFPYHNHVGVETWIHAAFWAIFPLPLWMIELSRRDGRARINYLLLAGVALGLYPILSSEYALIAGPFAVLYLLARLSGALVRKQCRLSQALGACLLVGGVALGSATFFVLPAVLEVGYVGIHAKHGAGTTFTNELLRDYAITPSLVWYAIARRLHLPADSAGLPGLVQSFWSVAWYPGVIVPPLVALGLGAVRRHFAARAALIGLVLTALLATGPTCALNFFSRVPVFGRLSPFRGMLLGVTFASVLVAFGVRQLLCWLAGKWSAAILAAGLTLLILADFWPSAAAYQTTESYFSSAEQRAYTWLAARGAEGRLWEFSPRPRDEYVRSYSLSVAPMLRHHGYYDNGAPLYTWQQTAWTDLATLLRLHQVRYVLVREGEPDVDKVTEALRAAGYRPAFEAEALRLWENPANGVYARFYGQAALDVTQDFHHPFRALPEFVWRDIAMVTPESFYLDDHTPAELQGYRYLLVDEPAARDAAALSSLSETLTSRMVRSDGLATLRPAPQPRAALQVERVGYEEIRVTASAAERGVLTIAESWYPHWRVSVDGQPRQALRVNWALLGVWLEPGEHRVTFHFQRPWYVYGGYGVSLLTWLALLSWWAIGLGAWMKRAVRQRGQGGGRAV